MRPSGRRQDPDHDRGRRIARRLRRRRPAYRANPQEQTAPWRARRVGIDYHIDIDKHYYSVPHRFARTEVEVRLTGRTVEIFAKGERIATHLRSSGNGKHTTVQEHMPSSHRRYANWTLDRIRKSRSA